MKEPAVITKCDIDPVINKMIYDAKGNTDSFYFIDETYSVFGNPEYRTWECPVGKCVEVEYYHGRPDAFPVKMKLIPDEYCRDLTGSIAPEGGGMEVSEDEDDDTEFPEDNRPLSKLVIGEKLV